MKAVAWTLVLGILAPAAAPAAPQQAGDGIVTVKKRASTWSFKITPEGRKKVVIEGREIETDFPQRLEAAWAHERYAPLPGQAFTFDDPVNSDSRTVMIFREGKRYLGHPESPAQLSSHTRSGLSRLQKAMVEEFYQFDLDFPGGTWEELARLLRDRLAAAYEQQFPEILKPFLPAKVDIEVSSKRAAHARYPAIQAKAVTLALLRSFGPAPVVEGKTESIPRVEENEDKSVHFLVMDVRNALGLFVLEDHNALAFLDELDVAFFHLGSNPALPGADHVVALFEMAWKARGKPLYAKVKYHPETKTLMVQGTGGEIESADKVFSTLTGRPAPVAPTANPFDSITQTLQKIAELIEKQSADKDK